MASAIAPAQLLSRRSHILPDKLLVSELFFKVPLDHSKPESSRIRLFARSVQYAESPPATEGSNNVQKPWLVYIPGGPGFGARPPETYGVTRFLLDKGYQLLYFDHRGMGLSTPITAATLVRLAGPSASAQAAYLRHFRADNCVRDLEAVRKCLTEESANEDSKKWSVMGQSYGGFVAVSYLSKFPKGLKEVFTMGGLPPVTQKGPDEVYRRLYRKVMERNQAYYRKFPEDGVRVKRILGFLTTQNVLLPTGGVLTPGRFMDMGIRFGSHGGLDAVHDIVLQAANDLEIFGFLTRPTLTRIESQGAFDDYCLYAILHEPIYSQGDVQSDWSADRVLKEFPRFDHQTHEAEILFTGEMIFKRTFAEYPELNRLEPAAEILSKVKDWSELYDVEQLKRNQVPVYSSTYVDDMYVDFGFARETAALIKGCKTFVTNALYHDASSKKAEELMRALFFLKEDSID